MIEAYSLATDVAEASAIPFNNIALKKGCTVELSGNSSLQFNKCGIYMVACTASSGDNTTIQLYKNGVAQPQAQSIGNKLGFVTLVQVTEDNTCCPCSAPTICEIINSDAATFDSIDIVVTKVV